MFFACLFDSFTFLFGLIFGGVVLSSTFFFVCLFVVSCCLCAVRER